MPYIPMIDRAIIDECIYDIVQEVVYFSEDDNKIDGKINYTIMRLLKRIYQYNGESYFDYNRAMGVLECVKQEFYRRYIAPYEDKKKDENGDI